MSTHLISIPVLKHWSQFCSCQKIGSANDKNWTRCCWVISANLHLCSASLRLHWGDKKRVKRQKLDGSNPQTRSSYFAATTFAPKQHVWQIGSTTGGLVSAAPAFILVASFFGKVTKKDFQEKLVSAAAAEKNTFPPPGKNPQLFNRLRRKGNWIKTFFFSWKTLWMDE